MSANRTRVLAGLVATFGLGAIATAASHGTYAAFSDTQKVHVSATAGTWKTNSTSACSGNQNQQGNNNKQGDQNQDCQGQNQQQGQQLSSQTVKRVAATPAPTRSQPAPTTSTSPTATPTAKVTSQPSGPDLPPTDAAPTPTETAAQPTTAATDPAATP